MASTDRVSLGKLGEDLACRELQRLGYEILARRVRTRSGELDIVARDRGTVVFIEVKARRTTLCGSAAEAVNLAKQRTMVKMALRYLNRRRWMHLACRFDVVAVTVTDSAPARVDVIRNAFDVSPF